MDKDLRRLAGRWNTLPKNLKKAILSMAGIQENDIREGRLIRSQVAPWRAKLTVDRPPGAEPYFRTV